jgi:hypothetical protein
MSSSRMQPDSGGPPAKTAPTRNVRRAAVIPICRTALVLLFLGWFAQFYRSGYGFTYVLLFNRRRADSRVSSLRDVPVYVHPGAGYDGQFYVQLAADPLVRDPSIDDALDSAPFRARRILFSWTAWILGFGRPAWIVQAYSVQNVLFWLVLALWLRRRLTLHPVQDLLVWSACLFAPGLLDSTRMALLDGPSLLVVACGVDAIERGRFWVGSLVLGVAGLARETNLLAGVALSPRRLRPAALARFAAGAALVFLPSLIWFDYLRSIYRSTVTQSLDQLSAPAVAFVDAWRRMLTLAGRSHWWSADGLALLAIAGVTVQAIYLLRVVEWRRPWWRVGVAFIGLLLVIKGEIWLGAYLRVLLPLTLAFNLLLPRGRAFWPWFVAGNLGLGLSIRILIGPLL